MITIKAPLELKIRSDLAKGYDSFGERIAGNYALMGLEIGEEELLHMVSSPPEIYLMDEGSTTIGGNTFISSRNEEKYNIINNMLNRILLSVDGELTYQDRTYITDALHKLGIKDDRKFMTQVRRMIDESHLEEAFLNNYFEMVMGGENRELRERTLELTKELAERDTYNIERSEEDFLSERILHRLRTGAIYQIVSNFNKSLNDTRIELQESMLSEQENVARKLLVQSFMSNVIREEPDLIHTEQGRTGAGDISEQVLREISEIREGRPGETVREERTRITEQRERELREAEQLRIERETALFGERETAEIVYREGETGTAEPSEAGGATTERVIVERTRVEAPGTTEYRIREQIRTEQEPTSSLRKEEEAAGAAPEGERIISELRPGERVTERVTEEGTRITERRDSEHLTERTEQYLTERTEAPVRDIERTELQYREGENREEFEETILDRLTERTKEESERIRERLTSESRTTERTGSVPGPESRTERETVERVLQEAGETVLPGEERPGTVTERITEGGERVTERSGSEQYFDHTNRYVTEQGEILRTEHESSELIYREGAEAPETETAGTEGTSGERIRETSVLERERIREAGAPEGTKETIPGAPGERVTEERSRLTERESTEYHTTDRITEEPGQVTRTGTERTETIRETGGEPAVPGESIRERLEQELTSELLTERERTEAELRTDRYVTEQGEILRTEHESSELIYREGAEAPESETVGEEGTSGEMIRETSVIERERIREAGAPEGTKETVPGAPGERVTEERSRLTERESTEYRTTDRITEEPGQVIRTESEHTETIRETGGEPAVPGESIRERLEQEITSQLLTERERTEAELRTDRYVTEQGEILRTEHESSELIYREGAETPETETAGTEGTSGERIRETSVLERERIREAGTPEEIKETIPGAPGERVTEERSRLTERESTEYRTTDRITEEPGQVTRTGTERTETIRETGGEPAVPGEHIRERLEQEFTSELLTERERTEAELRTDRYVTEQGEILRTEHEGAELIYREGAPAPESETAGAEGTSGERLRETDIIERERIRETEAPEGAKETIPGASGERVIEERSRLTERESTEYRTTDRITEEPGQVIRTGTERTETIRETGGEPAVPGERIRERLEQEITSELLTERERTEAELQRERTEQYVTEAGEILRTEHEGAELIYREGGAAEAGETGTAAPGTTRETYVTESERIRETGAAEGARERIPGEPGERVTEERISRLEREHEEYRTREKLTKEQEQILRSERERMETILRESGGEGTVPEERLRERLEERIISGQVTDRERTETERSKETREQYVTEAGEILRTAHEGAEMIYREGAAAETEGGESTAQERITTVRESERERIREQDRLERDRSSIRTSETVTSSLREELREQLREERLRTERTVAGETPEPGRIYERTEMIHRREAAEEEGAAAASAGRTIRETERYRSDNVYEREILEKERSKTEVTAGLTAAVLLDVVKTMFHAGYDRIGRGDTWIEYRGALYHSAENIFNRLNYNLEQRSDTWISTYPEEVPEAGLELTTLNELQEITENAGDIETIENTIREMNEMNLRNVERYQQMVQVLQNIRPERNQTGGMERTRQEALSLLDDEQSLYESLQHAENAQEEERRKVFHEITRIFPEQSVEVFKVVERYLDGAGQQENVGIRRNNVEEAAEEIRRLTMAQAVRPEPEPEPVQTESSELIYRRNDRVTQEELQEMVESLRRSENLRRREIEQRNQQTETDRRSTTTLTTNTERRLSRQEAEDIEALVNRGVRSQMSAISEQVLQKLEKKLKNEKIRRGI
ncbi:MAG: hypothetical protein IJM25_08695 [Eubacterium sp.]|nr:hypothetical protein [Eubacterium sp.]